ncbi:MAG: hypothetical protein IT514_16355, partial [Burkholderiales bacterium]|nr:hypothetical protein [Burkholderiales bacterium]
RVEGYTNFLWVVGAGLLSKVGLPANEGVLLLSLLAGCGGVILVGAVCLRGLELSPAEAAAAAVGMAFLTPWAAWAWSGMETCGFGLLWLAAVWVCAGSNRMAGAVTAGVLAALTAMTRPEGALLAIVLPMVDLAAGGRRGHSGPDSDPLPPAGGPGCGRGAAASASTRTTMPALAATLARAGNSRSGAALAVFLVLAGGYFAWRWCYFGQILPNTFYAKVGHPGPALAARGAGYLGNFLLGAAPLCLLAAWGAVRGWGGRRRPMVVALGWGVAVYSLLGVVLAGGDHFAMYRFCAPMLPWLAVLAAIGVREIAEQAAPKTAKAWTVGLLPAAFGVALLGLTAIALDPTAPAKQALLTVLVKGLPAWAAGWLAAALLAALMSSAATCLLTTATI